MKLKLNCKYLLSLVVFNIVYLNGFSQTKVFEQAFDAYYNYEYSKSISLFNQAKTELNDQKLILKADAFIAISNIYLGEYGKAITGLNNGFTKSTNLYGESSLTISDFYTGFGKYYEILEVYDTALIFNSAAMGLKQIYLPEDHLDFLDVYVNMGIAYDYSGSYDSAIVYYQKGLDVTVKKLGENHPYAEYLYNDMGVVYGFMEEHANALLMAQKALKVRSNLYGENSAEIAQSYHNIAVSQDALNQYKEALPNYTKAYNLKKELYQEQSKEMAEAYYSLGNSYSRNNQFIEAIKYNKTAYDIVNKLQGKGGVLTTKYLKNLGNVCFDGGIFKASIRYYSSYLELEKSIAISQFEKAETYLYLGQAHENVGDYKSAEVNFNKALDIGGDNEAIVYNVFISLARIRDMQSDYDEAVKLLNEALEIAGENSAEAGFIFNNLGAVYINISDYKLAKINIDKSLNIRQKYYANESNEVAQTYSTLGNYYTELESYKKAFEYYEKSYDIKKKNYSENHPELAKALFNLSAALGNMGNYEEEIKSLNKVLKLNQLNYGLGYSGNASVYQNLCLVYDRKGKVKEAIEFGERAFELNAKNFGERSEQTADALATLAVVQHNFGLTKEALKNSQRALKIFEISLGKNHVKTANQYNNLGVTYMDTHEYEKSKSYFNQALSIYKKMFGESSSYVVSALANLALIEYERSEYDNAIKLYQNVIELGRLQESTYKPKQSIALQNLGLCYYLNEDLGHAIQYFRKAYLMREAFYGEDYFELADILINIGNYHLRQLKYDSSFYYFSKAESIYLKYYGLQGERVAGAYNNLAALSLKMKQYDKALTYNQKALAANKNSNGETNSFRQAFVSLVATCDINYSLYKSNNNIEFLKKAYDSSMEADNLLANAEAELFREDDKLAFSVYKSLLTNISIKNAGELYAITKELNYFDKALYFAERSKSGVLLSALKLSNVKEFDGVDNDLIAKEKSLELAIRQVKEAQFKLGISEDIQKMEGLQSKLFELNRELETIKKVEKQRFPKYYDMNNTALVDLAELQKDLKLKPNSAFIEYAISDSTLHAIVITATRQKIFSSALDEKFENKLKAFRKAIMFRADNVLNLISEEIYNVVFQQVEEFFVENNLHIDEVVIVPEGALNYLPFEALFRDINGTHQYLIENYAVSYNYSLSLFDFIEHREKTVTKNACLAFAPVFSKSSSSQMNSESQELYTKASNTMEDPSRAFTVRGEFISALPGTEREVKAIHEIAQNAGVGSKYFIYEEAGEEKLKSGILKDYKYLHFATHGFINEANPEFSGILMSQNKNSSEDCILYASEIYNLEINADLVTLSACETGLGKMAFGEGIVGLTRSFLYAGASNLLVSQWKVNDESTSDMMVDFYDKILTGTPKAQALREAKLSILKNDKFKNPYYWAPFVLIGE